MRLPNPRQYNDWVLTASIRKRVGAPHTQKKWRRDPSSPPAINSRMWLTVRTICCEYCLKCRSGAPGPLVLHPPELQVLKEQKKPSTVDHRPWPAQSCDSLPPYQRPANHNPEPDDSEPAGTGHNGSHRESQRSCHKEGRYNTRSRD